MSCHVLVVDLDNNKFLKDKDIVGGYFAFPNFETSNDYTSFIYKLYEDDNISFSNCMLNGLTIIEILNKEIYWLFDELDKDDVARLLCENFPDNIGLFCQIHIIKNKYLWVIDYKDGKYSINDSEYEYCFTPNSITDNYIKTYFDDFYKTNIIPIVNAYEKEFKEWK